MQAQFEAMQESISLLEQKMSAMTTTKQLSTEDHHQPLHQAVILIEQWLEAAATDHELVSEGEIEKELEEYLLKDDSTDYQQEDQEPHHLAQSDLELDDVQEEEHQGQPLVETEPEPEAQEMVVEEQSEVDSESEPGV